ncbi:uncharacterized protein EI97DRAFT_470334 [Westerdykella ornata]|uniref:Uncharacterized protein n=1 Tax=Westerdykella ornata TaxID=318751 RepID=A0A6A6J8K4_WESOR|nr:uncharacterized protein EI97DRAFT_470334 [Westerdykella ornata]KAF2272483.1 hypothetical protein EI97DRAFT_470334 [Westerdykella ornata]
MVTQHIGDPIVLSGAATLPEDSKEKKGEPTQPSLPPWKKCEPTLLGLPMEVRLKIMGYLILSGFEFWSQFVWRHHHYYPVLVRKDEEDPRSETVGRWAVETSLFRVNRQISEEASCKNVSISRYCSTQAIHATNAPRDVAILYEQNTFVFDACPDWPPATFDDSRVWNTFGSLDRLRNINIVIDRAATGFHLVRRRLQVLVATLNAFQHRETGATTPWIKRFFVNYTDCKSHHAFGPRDNRFWAMEPVACLQRRVEDFEAMGEWAPVPKWFTTSLARCVERRVNLGLLDVPFSAEVAWIPLVNWPAFAIRDGIDLVREWAQEWGYQLDLDPALPDDSCRAFFNNFYHVRPKRYWRPGEPQPQVQYVDL